MSLSVSLSPPEAPVTLILFPDALFVLLKGAVGELTLSLSTLWRPWYLGRGNSGWFCCI